MLVAGLLRGAVHDEDDDARVVARRFPPRETLDAFERQQEGE